jgi:suppressor for copper-sensitivity B
MGCFYKTGWLRSCLQRCVIAAMSVIGLLILAPAVAYAAASGWVNSDFSQIRLIAVSSGAGADGVLQAGLHIRMDPGWKTYWRSPGDSGVPTIVDWSASENVTVSEIRWPLPHRLIVAGYQSFVYQDEIVLPLVAKIDNKDKAIRLVANVDYAVCKEICVPLQAALSISLKPGQSGRGGKVHLRLLSKYQNLVPGPTGEGGLKVATIELNTKVEKQVIELTLESDREISDPQMFLEAPQPFSFSVPKVTVSDRRRKAHFSFAVNGGIKKLSLAGNRIVVTAGNAGQAIEMEHQLQKN